MDKYSRCPNCEHNFDGGDIYEVLCSMGVFLNKSVEEIDKIVSRYGWTASNKARFSNVTIITLGVSSDIPKEITLYQCPNCKQVYNAETEEKFFHLHHAKQTIKDKFKDNGHNTEFLSSTQD